MSLMTKKGFFCFFTDVKYPIETKGAATFELCTTIYDSKRIG